MKTWDDVTKEELIQELCPGVTATNDELENQLNWFEYLRHFRDMLDMGMTDDLLITREHIQDVLADIFMTSTRIIEERGAEPGEIREYITSPMVQETINNLTQLVMGLTKETFPEFKEKICKEVGIDPEEI